MAFEKGNKLGGRTKGSTNKVNQEIRLKFLDLLKSNMNTFQKDLDELEPKDRLKIMLEMASFCTPKLKAIELETDVWLIFAPIKSFRMNITIQKATELGVSRFIPCLTQNTNQTKINIKSFNMNIIEASEQSERLTLPKLNEVVNLNNLLRDFPKDRGLIFCNENDKNLPNIFKALENKSSIFKKWAILIGPEGGFSETETKEILSISSTIPVSLGKRILRSDTATTVALFAVQSFVEQ